MPANGTPSVTALIVEDFADSRSIMKHALENRGDYRILEAIDGQEAVEIARRDCPDLILMDLNLPNMDGLTATRRIRECQELCKDIPIIAVTGHDTYGIEKAALEAGCDAYLTKPIDFDELERVIRRTLIGW